MKKKLFAILLSIVMVVGLLPVTVLAADSTQFSAIHAWHRAPMRDAGKFKMQLVSMGRYFKKWGCGKGKV